MALEILMTRQGNHLVPYDQTAEEDLQTLPTKPVMVTVKTPRSLPHNRLYWACLRAMAHAGAATSSDDIHDASKLKCGLVRMAQTPDGQFFAFPDSTSFAKLDQAAFNAYFDKAIQFWKSCRLWDYLAPDLQAKLEAGER